jgi:diadenosine tetraphosphate (Ap4A) HIT family hydrolase
MNSFQVGNTWAKNKGCLMPDCPFCSMPAALEDGTAMHNELAYVREDKFPVSPGHLLVIPKRHTTDWFSLTDQEQAAITHLINQAKTYLDERYAPGGYNIGMNCGEAAGQTVPHMHCHLIPRYDGDVDDPRGGVRWVKADRADYWRRP